MDSSKLQAFETFLFDNEFFIAVQEYYLNKMDGLMEELLDDATDICKTNVIRGRIQEIKSLLDSKALFDSVKSQTFGTD